MNNNVQSPEVKTKNITLGFVVSWILAVVIGVAGLATISSNFFEAVILLITALVLLPPFNTFVHNKMNMKISGALKFVLVVILIIIAVVVSTPANKSTSVSNTNPSNTQVQPTQPVMTVSAIQLNADYQANQISADAKYKGKLIDVTGTINTIGKDVLNDPYVTLNTSQYSAFEVQCMFSQVDKSKLASLSSGQIITLQGIVNGQTLTNVIIDGCSIVK